MNAFLRRVIEIRELEQEMDLIEASPKDLGRVCSICGAIIHSDRSDGPAACTKCLRSNPALRRRPAA